MSGSPNIIDKAIDYIHEHGWTKNTWRDDDGAVCGLGAMYVVGSTSDGINYGISALYDQLRADLVDWNGLFTSFNDDPNTTLEDVLLLMKKASARLDEAQSA